MLAFYSDYPCSASCQTPPCTGILQDIHVQSPLTQLPTPPPSPITWTQQDEGLGRCSHIPNSIFKSFPCSLLCWWQDLWMQHSQLGFFPHFSSFELCHSLPVPGKMCLWQQHLMTFSKGSGRAALSHSSEWPAAALHPDSFYSQK